VCSTAERGGAKRRYHENTKSLSGQRRRRENIKIKKRLKKTRTRKFFLLSSSRHVRFIADRSLYYPAVEEEKKGQNSTLERMPSITGEKEGREEEENLLRKRNAARVFF
jgi:hypothetical protein